MTVETPEQYAQWADNLLMSLKLRNDADPEPSMPPWDTVRVRVEPYRTLAVASAINRLAAAVEKATEA